MSFTRSLTDSQKLKPCSTRHNRRRTKVAFRPTRAVLSQCKHGSSSHFLFCFSIYRCQLGSERSRPAARHSTQTPPEQAALTKHGETKGERVNNAYLRYLQENLFFYNVCVHGKDRKGKENKVILNSI